MVYILLILKQRTENKLMNKYEERCKLAMEMKLKKIKFKDIAEHCDCSSSWVSQYFNSKVDFTKDMETKMINYINNK